MARKQTEESILTKEIRDYLKIRNIFHWKQWQGLGSTKGVADIIGIYKGRFLAIELKSKKGKASDDQLAFLCRVQDEGGIAFVAKSLDDVINNLTLADQGKI